MKYSLSNKYLLTSLFQIMKFNFKLLLQIYTFVQVLIRFYRYE